MKDELEKKLVNKYPKLYEDYGGSIYETCMGRGFECGDGWYDIIDELSAKLEPLNVKAEQVKEKFGGLRFYVSGRDGKLPDETYDYIQQAEDKSGETCEVCGKPGKKHGESWIVTRCDKCGLET